MQTDGRRAKEAAFSAVSRRPGARLFDVATGAYAALLVALTHYPRPEDLLGRKLPSDKLLHFMAYLLLGLLAAACVGYRRAWTWRAAAVIAAGLAVFAAIDEATQPLFRRAAEPLDWVFDCLGIAVGIAIVAAVSSWASARGSR